MDKQELKLVARILENLPNMSSGVMQSWIENPSALKKLLSELSPEGLHIFDPLRPINIKKGNTNPHEFFEHYNGLIIHTGFEEVLNSVRNEKVKHDEIYVKYIVPHTEDALNVSMLPNSCIFEDVTTFLISLKTLVRGRGIYSGKRDTFLAEIGKNIFFVRVHECVIGVYVVWFDEYGHWLFDTFEEGVRGNRLYFPTAP